MAERKDSDETIGIYVGRDAKMIEEFDTFFETRPGSYSRSREIKNAMKVYLTVMEFVDERDLELGGRDLELWLHSAMLAYWRSEYD